MPTSFVALSNDGIAALILQPQCLIHRRCRGNDLRAGRPDPLQQITLRQAEVKADDLGRELLHKLAHGAVEGGTGGTGNGRLGIKSEFEVVSLQPPLPGILASRIGL